MHRLFLGLPVPDDGAALVEEWARRELDGIRVVARDNLHVTLLFFGEVPTSVRDELVGLTQAAWWEPLDVETGDLARYGRTALALELEPEVAALERLGRRVAFSAYAPPGMTEEEELRAWFAEHSERQEADPLYRMVLRLPQAELTRMRRRRLHDFYWSLHLTIGRSRSKVPPEVLEKRMPSLRFILDRLVLYESHLGPGGSDYAVIAEGRTNR